MANKKKIIYADNLLLAIRDDYSINGAHFARLKRHIDAAPAVDAVKVVRCKDCKHYEIHKPKVLENCERNGHLIPMKPDDFCSYGEMRTDNA